MPIDTQHPHYQAFRDQWQRCRDVIDGGDAVKSRGDIYLPRLKKQDAEDYNSYKMRAYWFGGTARTVEGLTGAIMRRDPNLESMPEFMSSFLKDVTYTETPFAAFVKTCLHDVIGQGRYGVLVEMPAEPYVDGRPYWVGYQAHEITNWQTSSVNGIQTLSFVVLYECMIEEDPDDPYILHSVEQYRELYLEDGIYGQQVWRKAKTADGSNTWTQHGPPVIPRFRGAPLDYIPFCFISPTTVTPAVVKSPILDLVDANLSHYRTSADLEHGRHYCGLPTPWVAGFPKDHELPIGSSVAWVTEDVNAHAGILEFTGQGLGALEMAIKDKKQDMAILGARLLESQQASVEAADTLKTRLAGEQSTLQSIAGTLSVAFTIILRWTAAWMGGGEVAKKIEAKLNTEFLDLKMTFAELTQLVQGWQSGAMSYETLYYNMERGGLTRPGITWRAEKAQIESERPPAIPQNIDPETGLPMSDLRSDGSVIDDGDEGDEQ